VLLLILSGVLAGCGGTLSDGYTNNVGGGTSGCGMSSPTLEGIYLGTFMTPGAGTTQVFGAVLPTGFGLFSDVSGDVYVLPTITNPATISGTLDGYAGSGRMFSNSMPTIGYGFTGAASTPDSSCIYESISGEASTGGLQGALQVSYESVSASAQPLSILGGSYTGYYLGSRASINITINNTGVIAGSDINGCVITGQLTPEDGNLDLFAISADISGASPCQGNLSGIAYVDMVDRANVFAAPGNYILYMEMANASVGVMMEVQK
jgi:hypothetical protein